MAVGEDQTLCIRCDEPVKQDPSAGLTLTYNHELGAVKVCNACAEIVKQRDHWK